MTHQAFFDALKSGSIARVYLFSGEEEHVKRSALKRLRERILTPGLEQINETILDNPTADAVIAACETLPMMDARRLVVVRDSALLTSGRARDEAAEAERLTAYVKRAPETTCLVFYCTGTIDKRKKLAQALSKGAEAVQFSPLDDVELARWIRATCRGYGKAISPQTAQYLAFTSGRDLTLLLREIEKLASYAQGRDEIVQQDVDAVATRTAECTVFNMVDAILAGQEARAFELLAHLLQSGEARIGILALIQRQYRQLMHVRLMQEGKVPTGEQMKRLGVPGFVFNRLQGQARAYDAQGLVRCVRLCEETDYAIKSGRVREDAGLERAMLRLCSREA